MAKATVLLRSQHRAMGELAGALVETNDRFRESLVRQLADDLLAHVAAEELSLVGEVALVDATRSLLVLERAESLAAEIRACKLGGASQTATNLLLSLVRHHVDTHDAMLAELEIVLADDDDRRLGLRAMTAYGSAMEQGSRDAFSELTALASSSAPHAA